MAIHIYTEERPWGGFRQFTKNQSSTVKILTVKAGEQFSLQYHHHREEFWRVLSGSGKVTVGEDVFKAGAGDEFTIPKGAKHRIQADSLMEVLELSFGEFDEEDIVRLEDAYGRLEKIT
jgi:mannose-6-phosphate isomerase-like protein (cupin superfamily)